MPWARIDDGFHSHPKIAPLSLAGRGLLVTLISYSANHLTDGAVPESIVGNHSRGRGGRQALHELTTQLLLIRDGSVYRIHDYLDYNMSRADVEAERAKQRRKKERQRARGKQAPSPDDPSPPSSPGESPGVSTRESRIGMEGSSTSNNGERLQDRAPGLVGEVMAELRKAPRLDVPDHCESAIDTAISSHPDKSPVLAAKAAAIRASDPAWRQTWGPTAFLYALRSQEAGEKPAGTTGQNVVSLDRTCARCRRVKVPAGMGAFCESCSEAVVS